MLKQFFLHCFFDQSINILILVPFCSLLCLYQSKEIWWLDLGTINVRVMRCFPSYFSGLNTRTLPKRFFLFVSAQPLYFHDPSLEFQTFMVNFLMGVSVLLGHGHIKHKLKDNLFFVLVTWISNTTIFPVTHPSQKSRRSSGACVCLSQYQPSSPLPMADNSSNTAFFPWRADVHVDIHINIQPSF